jgi:hypothetical protein
MKGIYLSKEGKKAIEDKIAELKIWSERSGKVGQYDSEGQVADELEEILSSATILPVEESWKHIGHDSGVFWGTDADILLSMYPNGVIIIQPKQ